MQYAIKLVYKDGNVLTIEVPIEEYHSFFTSLNEYKPYWGKNQKQAFWTNIRDVRYIQIFNEEQQETKIEPESVVA